jgi:nucleotide-binding universal stress UspA family protein
VYQCHIRLWLEPTARASLARRPRSPLGWPARSTASWCWLTLPLIRPGFSFPTVEPVGRTAVVLGIPAEALASFCLEERAELLVVGSRGRSRLAAALLGSVSASLTSADGCPVVVVPPDAADRFLAPQRTGGSVVCGINGSAESVRAAQVGGDFAERLGLELVRVHVDEGHAADGLRRCALADDCRLIMVGSHDRGALRGALLGSVSSSLAAAAPVPVLVVPPTARPYGSLAAGVARLGDPVQVGSSRRHSGR